MEEIKYNCGEVSFVKFSVVFCECWRYRVRINLGLGRMMVLLFISIVLWVEVLFVFLEGL